MTHPAPFYLPPDFLDMMQAVMPASLSLEDFITYCQKPLRRSIRVNTLKISVADFMTQVQDYGWQLTPIPWCSEGFWLQRDDEESVPLGSTAEHLSGLFYIQEASSMLPVCALFAAVPEPIRVLDMAAAPGSKTTQIAARMNNQGSIIANEYSASRVKVLHANISRCGITNTALTHFDGAVFGAALPEQFDVILLDAPCSGEGVIRKDRDALKNWSLESIHTIAQTQQQLINSAFHALKSGGVLVYSTCTLNRQENQAICQGLLNTYGDAVTIEPLGSLFPGAEQAVTAEGFLHVFPQLYDCEGFFVACLRKQHSVPPLAKPNYKLGKFPFTPLNQLRQREVTAAANQLGLTWDNDHSLWQRESEIWLFPRELEPLLSSIRFSRIGIKLAEQFPKGYRWQHEAVIALAMGAGEHCLPLDAALAREWYQGRDLYPEHLPPAAECIVTFQRQPIGIAKRVGNRIKNGLPRELVRDGILFDQTVAD